MSLAGLAFSSHEIINTFTVLKLLSGLQTATCADGVYLLNSHKRKAEAHIQFLLPRKSSSFQAIDAE